MMFVTYANEPFDNNRLYSGGACADGFLYLAAHIVYAPSISLFHALLVSIKHTLLCRLITVRDRSFFVGWEVLQLFQLIVSDVSDAKFKF